MADLLTVSRFALGAALVPLMAQGAFPAGAVVLAVAWMSDLLDGAAARRWGEGRLGRWDVVADASVGAGLAVGLAWHGVVPLWGAVLATAVLGGFLLHGNLAAGMLLQLSGYLPFLGLLWTRRTGLWWLPFLTASIIGVLEWRKLLMVNIPAFIRGLAGRRER